MNTQMNTKVTAYFKGSDLEQRKQPDDQDPEAYMKTCFLLMNNKIGFLHSIPKQQ